MGDERPRSRGGRYWELSDAIGASFYTVRREIGPRFPERVYSNGMAVALREQGIVCAREVPYEVVFRGVPVGVFRADLVVENKILVEAKVADRIVSAHREQAWHYLAASGLKVALILNFGEHASIARMELP